MVAGEKTFQKRCSDWCIYRIVKWNAKQKYFYQIVRAFCIICHVFMMTSQFVAVLIAAV